MKINKDTKTVIKAIFAWEDEKEELWLQKMAAEGWRLEFVAPYIYKFRRSAPEDVVYRLDYKLTLDKDYEEYLNLFRDSGWELFATYANWHYFRTNPQNHEIPEIYNSCRAKAQKYRRLLFVLLPLSLAGIFPVISIFESPDRLFSNGFISIIKILAGIVYLLMYFSVIRVWVKIRKLESQSKE
jgi:hypothetical protein